jgi:hypothetical protein
MDQMTAQSFGGTPESGFRPFAPYARFQGTGVYGKNRRSSPRTEPGKALAVFLRNRCTRDRASCRRVHEIGRGQGIQEPFEVRPRRLPVLDPPVAQGFNRGADREHRAAWLPRSPGPLHDGPNAGALPICSATAPALTRFEEEHRSRGLVVIGVYHRKDPEPLDVEAVRGYSRALPVHLPVAVDREWQTLKPVVAQWPRAVMDERKLPHRSARLDPSRTPGRQAAPDTDDFRVMRAQIEALSPRDP